MLKQKSETSISDSVDQWDTSPIDDNAANLVTKPESDQNLNDNDSASDSPKLSNTSELKHLVRHGNAPLIPHRKKNSKSKMVTTYKAPTATESCPQCSMEQYYKEQIKIYSRNEDLRNVTLYEINNNLKYYESLKIRGEGCLFEIIVCIDHNVNDIKISGLEQKSQENDHISLENRLNRSHETVEALNFYVDCLILEQKASFKFFQLLNRFICNERTFVVSPKILKLLQELCRPPNLEIFDEIKPNCNKKDSEQFQSYAAKYKEAKTDFELASKNFCGLLKNTSLENHQMEKLRQQYHDIFLKFQHTRLLYSQEIPDLIAKQLEILSSACLNLSKTFKRQREFYLMAENLFENLMSMIKRNSHIGTNNNINKLTLLEKRNGIENCEQIEENCHCDKNEKNTASPFCSC